MNEREKRKKERERGVCVIERARVEVVLKGIYQHNLLRKQGG